MELIPKEYAKKLINLYLTDDYINLDELEQLKELKEAKKRAFICFIEIENVNNKFYGQDKDFSLYMLAVASELINIKRL